MFLLYAEFQRCRIYESGYKGRELRSISGTVARAAQGVWPHARGNRRRYALPGDIKFMDRALALWTTLGLENSKILEWRNRGF